MVGDETRRTVLAEAWLEDSGRIEGLDRHGIEAVSAQRSENTL